MSSQNQNQLARVIFATAILVFLLFAATSCSYRLAPPVPKSSSTITAPTAAVLPPRPRGLPSISPRPKTLLPIAFPDLDTGQISSVQFSPDGRRLAFGYGADAEITMWSFETGKPTWQRHVAGTGGGPLVFDPQGRFLVIQCYDLDFSLPIRRVTVVSE